LEQKTLIFFISRLLLPPPLTTAGFSAFLTVELTHKKTVLHCWKICQPYVHCTVILGPEIGREPPENPRLEPVQTNCPANQEQVIYSVLPILIRQVARS
jgi:hypothetical protein